MHLRWDLFGNVCKLQAIAKKECFDATDNVDHSMVYICICFCIWKFYPLCTLRSVYLPKICVIWRFSANSNFTLCLQKTWRLPYSIVTLISPYSTYYQSWIFYCCAKYGSQKCEHVACKNCCAMKIEMMLYTYMFL